MPYKDPVKRQEYLKEYHLKNKEEQSLKAKAYYERNRDKILARQKDYQRNNSEKVKTYKHKYYVRERETILENSRRVKYKTRFNITPEQFEEILEDQNGVCAICGKSELKRNAKRLSIDHNHDTGELRGLLCYNCNSGLGQFKDNIELLLKAAQYLKENN